MGGWHHRLNGHEFEQAPGVGDGQGSLVCCSPWGHKELDMTDRLNSLTDLSCGTWDFIVMCGNCLVEIRGIFSYSMCDLVPPLGIEVRSPAFGTWSLSH